LLRISKEWRGLRFSSYLASTYLRIYVHTYVLNSDESLTEQDLNSLLVQVGKLISQCRQNV
jgi:hypothetical protein